jgi:site-specific DNA-methyltransferase (adenine-specific)
MIADPPDNLGLDYDGFLDKNPEYYAWVFKLICKSLAKTDHLWLSYYWEHDLQIKSDLNFIKKSIHPGLRIKTFIWRYTFGQYRESDCGSGFRFLVRLSKRSAKLYPDAIRIPSKRMALGDSRAKGPRVPDDVWDFPRVVGNSTERQPWHPTQHPAALYHRIIALCSTEGDTVVDLFAGSGTIFRQTLPRNYVGCEISESYQEHLKEIINGMF